MARQEANKQGPSKWKWQIKQDYLNTHQHSSPIAKYVYQQHHQNTQGGFHSQRRKVVFLVGSVVAYTSTFQQ